MAMVDLEQFVGVEGSAGILIKTIATCGIIWLAGRTLVQWLQPLQPSHKFRNPNYIAVGAGAAVVMILTWIYKVFLVYSFVTMMGSLIAIGVLLFWSQRRRQPFWAKPSAWPGAALFLAYGFAAVSLFVLVPPDHYSKLKETSIYLAQGFNLFLPLDPAVLPHYGITFVAALADLNLPISAVFGLLSYGNHVSFYAFGEYWANVIIGPSVLVGAYLVHKRFFPWWAALVLSALFCAVALDVKVWSLRGESLGWIVGFATLLVLLDLLDWLNRDVSFKVLVPPAGLLALLYVTTALTHPLIPVLIAFLAFGLAAFHLPRWGASKRFLHAFGTLGVFACVSVGLFAGMLYTFSKSTSVTETHWDEPRPGESDAASDLDNALAMRPADSPTRIVLAHPPYAKPLVIAGLTLVLPVAGTFRPEFDRIASEEFPGLAIARLDALPLLEVYGYLFLFLFCVALQCSPLARRIDWRRREVFWMSAGACGLIVALAVYLDFQSVATFPLAHIRRAFPYVRLFFWGVLIFTVSDLARPFLRSRVARVRDYLVKFRAERSARDRLRAALAQLAGFVAQSRTTLLSGVETSGKAFDVAGALNECKARSGAILRSVDGETPFPAAGANDAEPARARNVASGEFQRSQDERFARVARPWRFAAETAMIALTFSAWFALSVKPWAAPDASLANLWSRRQDAFGNNLLTRLQPLSEVVSFIRKNTAIGDLVITNTQTENFFWYLTSGRRASLDGVSIYQLFDLQRAASRRIRAFADFLQTADLSAVKDYELKYLVLYKTQGCEEEGNPYDDPANFGGPIFPTNLSAFLTSPWFTTALENSRYVILQRLQSPKPHIDQQPDTSDSIGFLPAESLPRQNSTAFDGWVSDVSRRFDTYRVRGWIYRRGHTDNFSIGVYAGEKRIAAALARCPSSFLDDYFKEKTGAPVFKFDMSRDLLPPGLGPSDVRFFAANQEGQVQELACSPNLCGYPGAPPYAATLADGIEFARPGYPEFIVDIRGLGRLEPWGRWSVDDEVAFRFSDPLPKHFVLSVKADAFGPNAEKPVIVAAGTVERQFAVYRNGETFRLDFDLPEPTSTITFKIPVPTSPHQFDPNQWLDERRLGIGFIELKIEEYAKGP